MNHLEFREVSFSYGKKVTLEKVSFCIEEASLAALVGPSGSGKTTILRLIAGFLRPKDGEIFLANQLIASKKASIPPEARQVGMVFQDLSLFPHLSVYENICFGLRKSNSEDKERRIKGLLQILDIEGLKKSFPSELSGGQQQRVALARALAPQPKLLLLDEPFSQIDPELREYLVPELAKVLRELKITALLVTHDQNEAFQFADRVGVVNEGSLCQWASPYQLYHQPISEFVADFVGQGSFLFGKALSNKVIETSLGKISDETSCHDIGSSVKVLIRPDDLVYDEVNGLSTTVLAKHFRGPYFLYRLELPTKEQVLAAIPSHINIEVNQQLRVRFDAKHSVVFGSKA